MQKSKIIKAIGAFALKHRLHIHPGQSTERWADLVIKKGGCPCVPGRKICPCPEALTDIRALGRCRCGLFCNDRYLVEYRRLAAAGR